jgi:hypothetical protein
MKNLQNTKKFLILKPCFVFTLFIASVFALLLGGSMFNLAAECPWIPAWIIGSIQKASGIASAMGIVAGIIATGGIGAAVAPIIGSYLKKYGLKLGLTL